MEFLLFLPFIVLLLSIAVMPFLAGHWWEKNYGKYSIALALIIVVYYVFFKRDTHSVTHTGIEYISFISLLTSLFVVSGGIFFKIKGKSTPIRNVITLLFGAISSNLFGTTGAAMLLIRPFINTNKYRLKPYHLVFFIFIVCNIGGSLTPIGDPPLFLGYLKGVPFFWIIKELWLYWLFTIVILLLIFYVIDKINYNKIKDSVKHKIEDEGEEIKFGGLYNIPLLFVIIGSVFITKPFFAREFIMLAVAVISYKSTPKKVHNLNKFTFEPIKEVALLFVGIFMTMMPVLEYLNQNSGNLGLTQPGQLYWAAGTLTSFLDNAPTYLNFFTLAMGSQKLSINNPAEVLLYLDSHKIYVIAISVSAVFFGAMTYIGNGPNFMVKSIADSKGIKMPSFFEYMYKYSIPVLLPVFFIIWLLFFS
jgi:Na+/H+ antiporter NhaD/arsenite permease-like protein